MSTNVLSPLSESNLQEENYNKMQDISSSPACSSQAGHTATEKPCSTIYLFRGHEYVQLKPRSAILEEGIRRLHPPPVASPPGKRCSAWNASWNISRFPCKKGKQKVRISGGGNAYLFFFFLLSPAHLRSQQKQHLRGKGVWDGVRGAEAGTPGGAPARSRHGEARAPPPQRGGRP